MFYNYLGICVSQLQYTSNTKQAASLGTSSATVFSSDPSDTLAVFPLTVLLVALACDINTLAVLLATLPVALIAATIRPYELAIALLFVVNILTDIFAPVCPGECALPVHLVVAPFTFVLAAI